MMNDPIHPRNVMSRRGLIRTGGLLMAGVTLGCALPGQEAPPPIIRLSPAEDFPPSLPSVAWTLKVAEPDATSRLNSARIAYVPQGEQMQYLATGEWASRSRPTSPVVGRRASSSNPRDCPKNTGPESYPRSSATPRKMRFC